MKLLTMRPENDWLNTQIRVNGFETQGVPGMHEKGRNICFLSERIQ
jgi:hypothetical protein